VTGPINLGNPTEDTISYLANEIMRLTNSNSKIIQLPLPEDDPKQRKPDIAKARTILGWNPEIELRAGLELTIADLSARLN
jgi:UDP-glucuronate decarboxylase